ncbi:MAG: cysteine--tRNA ligase [Aigarchaeota archaeon]|nr:cysteine--tRNA ligase [Candidatus Wolframiiraptor gerlachensis]
MPISVFNTLGRRIEIFEPLEPGIVKMYVCGPTVQDVAHLGHARTYIAFDAIIRFLEYYGYKVIYVRNITDVGHIREETGEDRVIEGARRERLQPMELVDKYMFSFFQDMDALGIRRPNIQPRASMHILDMIEMAAKLVERGYAYVVDGNVYFDVSTFPEYGKLSGIRYEELVKHRIEPDPRKKNPADFALWKKAEKGYLLKWNSPWGEGFPGWHIECCVMAMKYLGEQIDIHGGGQELILPHHENEIAQAEAYTGKKPFAKYWLHTGYLTINGEKMSKSLGNFISIKDALKKYEADAIRFFILSSHYRSQIDYNEDAMQQAQSSVMKIRETLDVLHELLEEAEEDGEAAKAEINRIEEAKKKFISAMEDDFNTPRALAEIHALIRSANAYISGHAKHDKLVLKSYYDAILELSHVLGLLQKYRPSKLRAQAEVKEVLDILLEVREELRRRRIYDISDRIRDRLAEIGIIVEDTVQGQRIKFRPR